MSSYRQNLGIYGACNGTVEKPWTATIRTPAVNSPGPDPDPPLFSSQSASHYSLEQSQISPMLVRSFMRDAPGSTANLVIAGPGLLISNPCLDPD